MMNKKNTFWKAHIFVFGLVCIVWTIPTIALAQDFVPLQNVPGVTDQGDSFSGFVNGLFWLSIIIGSILSVIVIAVGGFYYMGGESFSKKEEGIKYIQGAVGGLILLLLTVVIFTTINPNILNLNLNIKPVDVEIEEKTERSTGDRKTSPKIISQHTFPKEIQEKWGQYIEEWEKTCISRTGKLVTTELSDGRLLVQCFPQ